MCVSLEQSLLGNTVKEILLPFFMLKIQDICSDVYCNESVVMLTLNRCRNKHCACCPGSRSSYTPESSGLSLSKECSCCINKGPFCFLNIHPVLHPPNDDLKFHPFLFVEWLHCFECPGHFISLRVAHRIILDPGLSFFPPIPHKVLVAQLCLTLCDSVDWGL